MKNISYAIMGAGNGGLAMAGYLSLIGYRVNLYNRTRKNILPLIENPEIKLTGEIEGSGRINLATDNIEEAIRGTDIIMVTIPAMGHFQLAKEMAPYLENGQIIVLNPGRTGGALEFYNTVKSKYPNKNIIVAEAQTFIYACRAISRTEAHIFKSKKEVSLAAIPAIETLKVIELLKPAYPQFVPAKDVIETSINNYGAIFHPAPTLLNSGHIERGAPFEYYTEGITPSIGAFIERIDAERMALGRLLNVNTLSAKDWLYETYGAKGNNLYEAVQNNPAYHGLQAPKGLNIRYIYEDVPYSLVPMSSLAKQFNIETPAIDSIIRVAELMTGVNFYEEGRNVERLGLKGLKMKEIHEFAEKRNYIYGKIKRERGGGFMKKILACTIGNCVHVAGTMNFLNLAENEGYDTEFLGMGVPIDELIYNIKKKNPDIVALSYRLTPEPLVKILKELKSKIEEEKLQDITWIFGGTEPTGLVAKESGIFSKIFYGYEDIDEVILYLKGGEYLGVEEYPKDLISRINSKYPYPILRHHLGLPTIEETVEAIEKVAEAKVIDVISIAPDQNAQEFFFEQEKMDKRLDGAGGVPLRTEKTLKIIQCSTKRKLSITSII